MISRSYFVIASVLLASIAAFLHPTRAEAGVCEDLAAARAAAAGGGPSQSPSDEMDRAKERVAVAKVALASAKSAIQEAAAEEFAAGAEYNQVATASQRRREWLGRQRVVKDELKVLESGPARRFFEGAVKVEQGLWSDPRVGGIRVKIRLQERDVRRWFSESIVVSGVEEMRRAGRDPTNVQDLQVLRASIGSEDTRHAAESDIAALERLRSVDLKQALQDYEADLSTEDKTLLRRLRSGDLKSKLDSANARMQELEAELEGLEQQLNLAFDEQLLSERYQAKRAATERLAAAKRSLASAQTEYDEAQVALQAAEARLSGNNTTGPQTENPAEDKVRMLEQQLEATFQGPLHAVASQALEAMLQSTTQSECNERIGRAAASFQQLKALAQAHAACLTPSIQQRILQVRDQARNVKSQCDAMPSDTRRGDAGGGFESTGETTDVASETRAASVSADPGNAHVRSVQSAINSCNFDRALASLNLYRPTDPNDPWMARKYQEVHEGRERVAAVERLLSQVRGVLANNPSPDDIRYAAELLRTAGSVAPNCMSTSISLLGPAVNAAAAAARQADRERTREAVAGLADALVAVQDSILSQRSGGPDSPAGVPPVRGIDVPYPPAGGSAGGGFESAGQSGGGSTAGTAAASNASTGPTAPAAGAATTTQPSSQGNSTGCRWMRLGGLLGQDDPVTGSNVHCYCSGVVVQDTSRCTGPKP